MCSRCIVQDNYNLEQVCGGSSIFSSQDKAENMIINLIVPLCLRVGSGRKGNMTLPLGDVVAVGVTCAVLQMWRP